jgi:hypothetical protein
MKVAFMIFGMGCLAAVVLALMYGGRPPRREPGSTDSGWVGLGDTSSGDSSAHHHAHHSDAGHGGFDGGGGGHH